MKRLWLNRVAVFLLIVWTTIGLYMLWTSEWPRAGLRAETLQKVVQQIEKSARPQMSGKTASEREPELIKVLNELKQAVAANLAIREDAERAANWALWTLRLVGAVAFIVLGASLAGGYTLITSSKERITILENCRELQANSQQIVGAINEDARRLKVLLDNFQEKSVKIIANFEKTFAAFDFSKLNEVVDALFIKKREPLPAEERAKIEDYDVQIQVREMFGTTVEPIIYVNLGRYYRYVSEFGKALVRYERALEGNSGVFEAWIAKALCLAMIARDDPSLTRKQDLLRKAFIEGLDKARPLAQSKTEEFQLHFMEGWLLDEIGQFPEAIQAYERAGSLHPAPQVDYNIACSLAKSGQFERALDRLSKVTDKQILVHAAEDPDLETLRRDPIFGPRLKTLIRA